MITRARSSYAHTRTHTSERVGKMNERVLSSTAFFFHFDAPPPSLRQPSRDVGDATIDESKRNEMNEGGIVKRGRTFEDSELDRRRCGSFSLEKKVYNRRGSSPVPYEKYRVLKCEENLRRK